MSSTKLKPLYLMELFHKYSDSSNRLSAEDIVRILLEEYGIQSERKGIYRDINALIAYGLDIEKTTTGYYLKNRKFSLAEVRILISAVQAAPFITPVKTAKLTEKLLGFLSREQAASIQGNTVIGTVKYSNEEVYRNVEAINKGVSLHRKLSFFYYKPDITGSPVLQRGGKRYLVSPYAMIWLQDRYYLVCNVDGHDGLTHFRVDRIRGVYVEKQGWRHFSDVCNYRGSFDSADYARKCINMFGGSICRVVLKCKEELIGEILDRFGTNVSISRHEDMGYFNAIAEVALSQGFYAWTAQFLGGVEIVSPESARKRMREQAAELANVYKK